MNPSTIRAVVATGLLALTAGCVDGDGPTSLGIPRSVSFAALPRFASTPPAAVVAGLDRARVVLTDVDTDSILAFDERTIDPDDTEWAFDFTMDLLENQVLNLRLEIELIDGDPVVEVVEFAGRSVFPIRASFETQDIREINLGRGPLENLSLTALAVGGARSRIQEGGSDILRVDTIGAQPGQVVYFESTDPTRATVDSVGNIKALAPGPTFLIARAGRVADTLNLVVGAVNLPTARALQSQLTPHADYIAQDFFLTTMSDPVDVFALRDAIDLLVSEMLAGRGFEAVGRFEEAQRLWEEYGTESGSRSRDGVQLGVIAIGLMHAADALGVDFLRNTP